MREGAASRLAPLRDVSPRLRCRQIGADDLDAVVRLLCRGFPVRSDAYWRRGFARHAARALPPDMPRYGYLLEAGNEPVGVLLTFYAPQDFRPEGGWRCNLSSWYVDPRFRPHAALLDRVALRRADVTYTNVTPAPETWAFQKANGFVRYSRGQMLAVPALARAKPGVRVRTVTDDDPLGELDPHERTLVRDHASYGCLAFVWTDGASSGPIVLARRRIGLAGLVPGVKVPCLHLVYCRSLADLSRAAAPLGRLMLRRFGQPLLLLDAADPVGGLAGRFFAGRAIRLMRGPRPVEPGDLAYTELVLFGP